VQFSFVFTQFVLCPVYFVVSPKQSYKERTLLEAAYFVPTCPTDMNDSSPSRTSVYDTFAPHEKIDGRLPSATTTQLLKTNAMLPSMTASSEMLSQQLLCLNGGILSMAPSPTNPSQFSKEQLTEYQLAKMRFNQELLGSNSFYSLPYNYSPYAELSKGAASLGRVESNRYRYLHEEPKPQHSYIGLIAMAILSMPEQKMVLSDIYQHILDHYPYFRNRGPGWRNSIRHNLSLNDCFIKAGRSANGKGHYWAIHPANLEDFKKGDFRRRKAQRKVRKHMGLSVPDDDEDDDDSPLSSPTPIPDKSAMAASLLAPNPFMQAMSNPLFGASNSCFSQQAFNLFNTLRFALPTPHPFNANFNETFYRQLINLNIKQDLNRSAHSANRKEFSIESLLSLGKRSQERDLEGELSQCKLAKRAPECDANASLIDGSPKTDDEQCKLQPVNLKMN